MAYFPLFIDLWGQEILVVGGGPIAARRIRVLREFGCRILAVAPEAVTDIKEMEKEMPETVRWLQGTYEETDPLGMDGRPLTRPLFVLAAAGAGVNKTVVRDCRLLGIPVNDASEKENCSFYFPGIAKHGEAVAGVISGGEDHRLAAVLSEAVRKAVDAVMENMDQERLRPGFYCPRNMASFRASRYSAGTWRFPRPLPIRISGLAAPWKSEPPVGRRLYRSAIRQSLLLSSA